MYCSEADASSSHGPPSRRGVACGGSNAEERRGKLKNPNKSAH